MLDLAPLLNRRAPRLTADQKQKISLGRGLVRDDVAAILFDEPLTVIDPHLKWLLRRKLKEVHARFRHTLVYVTHDQNEALTFAEKVVVMYEGEVVQLGTPQELFERPAHRFVGYFIGSPGMNFLPCRLDGDGVRIDGTDAAPRRALVRGREERPERQAGARHPARVRERSHARPARRTLPATVDAGRGSRQLQAGDRAARPARAQGQAATRTRRCPAVEAHLALRAGAHAALCRRPADRLTGRPWTRPRTTPPGSWSCRCSCWWRSAPSSR